MANLKVLFVFVAALGVVYGTCPPLWTHYQDHCYRFFGPTKTWEEAEAHCKEFFTPYGRARLASIHGSDEYDFVWDMLATTQTDSSGYLWLGATDQVKEGNFTWTDGTAFNYYNWIPTQPDNMGGVEDCLHYHNKAEEKGWNDIACSKEYSYVCKVKNTE